MLVLYLETQNWLGIVKNNFLNVFGIYIQVISLDREFGVTVLFKECEIQYKSFWMSNRVHE